MNLYVHVPFCVSKCRYCGFYSLTHCSPNVFDDYLSALENEIQLRGCTEARPRTIFIGGGTPSILGVSGIRKLFSILPKPLSGAEVAIELNPADVTPELADALRECGVTRVSVGAQSFDDDVLRWLGRRHTAEHTRVAVSVLRHAGFENIGLDLIAAIPGMTDDIFEYSLAQAIALEPKHVSVYTLSIEAGTALARDLAAGQFDEVDDDTALDQIAVAESRLCHAGLNRYEISNYAVAGYECRHNLAVWHGEDYAGIGPGAASREGLQRRLNRADGTPEIEMLRPEEDEAERFITGFRLTSGQRPDSATALGRARVQICERLERVGMLYQPEPTIYALTPRGREVADAVMAELK